MRCKKVSDYAKCSQHKHMLKVMDLNTLLNQSLNCNCRANFHLLHTTINTVSQQGLTRGPVISLLVAFSVVHCSCSSDRNCHWAEENITHTIIALSPNSCTNTLKANCANISASACKRCRNIENTQFEAVGFWEKEDLLWSHQCYQLSQSTQTCRVFKYTSVCYTAF